MTTKIIVAGPRGKMGSEAIEMIRETEGFELVACLDRKGSDVGDKILDVPVFHDPETCFTEVDADILVDLTTPQVGYAHTEAAIKHHIRPVVGTSGFTNDQITELKKLAKEHNVSGIIAPNFAVGAVLLMKFSQLAAKYFPDVEIIEKHHDQKLDAPSGTAMKTADMITQVREPKKQGHPDEKETLAGARGGDVEGVRVHSVRLPGLVAHEEVIFGGKAQIFTLKHDSMNRGSFMDGIKLSIEEVLKKDELIYGLENIL